MRLLENGPRFEKGLDPKRTKFATDARVLESAPRRLRVIKHPVDRYATGKDLRSHAARAR
jgi:hypothetical protein